MFLHSQTDEKLNSVHILIFFNLTIDTCRNIILNLNIRFDTGFLMEYRSKITAKSSFVLRYKEEK